MKPDPATINLLHLFGDTPEIRSMLIEDTHLYAKALGHAEITKDIETLSHDELLAVFLGLQSLAQLRFNRFEERKKRAHQRYIERKENQPH